MSTDSLPADFFAGSGLDMTWDLLRTQVLNALREENSAGDNMLDLMLLERTSNLYAQLRQLEGTEGTPVAGVVGPAQYKDLSRLLVTMIESLRSQRDKDFIIEEARAEVMHALMNALKDALVDLPGDEAKKVLAKVHLLMAS